MVICTSFMRPKQRICRQPQVSLWHLARQWQTRTSTFCGSARITKISSMALCRPMAGPNWALNRHDGYSALSLTRTDC